MCVVGLWFGDGCDEFGVLYGVVYDFVGYCGGVGIYWVVGDCVVWFVLFVGCGVGCVGGDWVGVVVVVVLIGVCI